MRLWYLSHRRPVRAVSPEPLLFAHMKYGIDEGSDLVPLDDCACAFEEEFTEEEKYHNLMSWLNYYFTPDKSSPWVQMFKTHTIVRFA